MALAASTIWDCNASATAANVCGGAFNPLNTGNSGGPGLDYTSINNNANYPAALYTFTDLQTSNGTSATPTVTSSGHSFVGNDCGNILHINSGGSFTAGWYEIVSTSAGAATLDRACASIASTSGGTYHVGGALSLGDATDATALKAAVAGNKIYIKNGTYSFGAGATCNVSATAGTTSAYITLEGYNSTHGDRPVDSTRPLLNCATVILGNSWSALSLQWVGTVAGDMFQTGARGYFADCLFKNKTTSASQSAALAANYCSFNRCEFVSYNGHGLKHNSWGSAFDCYFHDSLNGVFNNNSSGNYPSAYVNNLFIGCTNAGISLANAQDTHVAIYGNTFIGGVGTKIGTGVKGATSNYGGRLHNNIFYGLAAGISLADSSQALQGSSYVNEYNDFSTNTADVTNITKGQNSSTANPTFSNIGQYAGTTATSSSSTLTDSGANFANVVAGRDYLYISASTGGNTGVFGISSKTSTTIVADGTLGSGSSITYSIIYGRNPTPTANILNSATIGAFPGATVTGYQAIGAVQPQYTDPGVAQVKTGTPYTYGGASATGTYDGSDRWTDPGQDNVRNGTAYKANSTSNNKTGDLVVPTAAQVKTGVTFESNSGTTGTYDGSDRWTDPGVNNVRNGTAYKANSLTNNETGNLVVPAVTDVKSGVTFDSNNSSTGTYLAACDYPAVFNVKKGITYSVGALTGTYDPLGVGSGIGPAAQLSERCRKLIIALIKANIATELAAIRTDRNDNTVSTEPPNTQSYFIYSGAHTYQTPAIFCVVDSGEVPDEKLGTNYVSALMKIYVSAVVSSQTEASTTVKCERYQAALFRILHQAIVTDTTDNVKIHILCKRFQFSELYTKSRKSDNMADFRKEVALELEVKHWENPIA